MRRTRVSIGGAAGVAGTALVALLYAAALGCQDGSLDPIALDPKALQIGLIAHYTFDEGTGTTVGDSSNQNHDGVDMGGTWIGDGRFQGAMHFDGLSTVTVSSFPFVSGSGLTVSYWIRSAAADAGTDAGTYQTVLSTDLFHVGGWGLFIDETSPLLGMQTSYWDPLANGYTQTECACVVPGVWTHVVSVFDPTAHTLSIYVNGEMKTSTPALHPIAGGTRQLFMGHWFGPGRFLIGDLDDVAIYNRPLSAAEIGVLHEHAAP